MLRGWLQRSSCAAVPHSRSSVLAAPRVLFSPCQGRSLLHQQAQAPSRSRRQPVVNVQAAGMDIGSKYKPPANYQKASSFDQLSLDSRLLEALKSAGLDSPTDIQSLAIPAIMSGGDYLLAAQTGSGKTLAYLLPVIHALKAREGEAGMERRGKRPKVLVLVPTKELVEQITSVAKSLCHYAKFRVVPCSANYNENLLSRSLTAPLEVLVATPTRLMKVMEHGRVALGDVRWLVVDEADTMLEAGKGFAQEVRHFVNILRAKEPPAQTILVTATMSKAVKQLVTVFLPELQRIEAAGFHQAVSTARHDFRPLPAGQDKMQLLLEVLQSDVNKGRKTLVFCSSMDSCRAVEHTVRERDIPTVCYHGDMPIPLRKEAMARFAGNHAAGSSAEGLAGVMVATDLAARGLDFPGTIDHVINFDMPSNAIDYLHRAGRTARGGAKGRVTSLLQSKRDRDMGKAIQYALDNNIGLDMVSASGAQQAAPAAQKPAQEGKWMPPARERRPKAPTPIKGQKQVVLWNPNHKFIHIRDGKPIVPFKELLKGTSGDERRRLLWEIAMDQKEWKRWQHVKAVDKADKTRQRQTARQEADRRPPPPTTADEKWKQKVAEKKKRRWEELREQQDRARSGGGSSSSGRKEASWMGRGATSSKQRPLFGRK